MWQTNQTEQVCSPEAQTAFDAQMEQLRLGLEAGEADPAIQARYVAVLQLAESIDGLYVRDDGDPPGPANDAGANTLQAVITAMVAGNANRFKQLIHYAAFECTEIAALGGPPLCRASETEGTPVVGLPVLGVEGVVVRPDEIDPVAETLLSREVALIDILADPVESYSKPGWLPANYAAVFIDKLSLHALALLTDDRGIVRTYDTRSLTELLQRVSGAAIGSAGEECLATRANGDTPPGEQVSNLHHGNGALWTLFLLGLIAYSA